MSWNKGDSRVVNRQLKIRRELVPIVQAYAATFETDSGKMVLADLEASYGGECYVRGDLYETLYRSFNRDLLERIKKMISYSGCEVEEEEGPNG
jgi:hypothetical protein